MAVCQNPGKTNKRCLNLWRFLFFKMNKTKKSDWYDREKKIRRVEKGTSKIDKHRKIIYNVASLQKDDDVFDEFLDYAYVNQKNKRR